MVTQNVNINIRVPKYLKDKFVQVAEKQDLVYSKILRNLIKDYIRQYEQNGGQDDRQRADTI